MNLDLKIISTKNEWDAVLSEFKNKDIFFEYNYFNLYKTEGEKPMMIYMETDIGKLAYPFMLRDTSFHPSLSEKIEKNIYFDIASPYGYSGPLIEVQKEEHKVEIIKLFYEKFKEFCKNHNVVSEFIKFSPILKNYEGMESVVETIYLKSMLAPNVGDEEYIDKEISNSRKLSVKKSRKCGIKAEFIRSPKSIDEQVKIYYDTMDRKNASEAFLFTKEYFKQIVDSLSEKTLLINIKLGERVVGFGLCFLSGDIIYAHVSGTYREYLKYSPSNISYYDTMTWGHENGYKYFFLGGGLTGSEEDSLYLYKKSFSNKTHFDFYIGKKIWNKSNYDYLVSISSEIAKENEGFFPAYREY